MKHTKTLLTAGIISTLLISGCASIVSGTQQNIFVQAVNQDTNKTIANANCVLTDTKGMQYTINTPGSAYISKGLGIINLDCKSKGFHQAQIGVGPSFDAWTIGNILFWPGVAVDLATGAAEKYPAHITVLMSQKITKHSVHTIKVKGHPKK